MGPAQSTLTTPRSFERINQELSSFRYHFLFGHYQLSNNTLTKEVTLKKDIIFDSYSDAQEFVHSYQLAEKLPFSLIYPKFIYQPNEFERCSTVNQVSTYFKHNFQWQLSALIKKEGGLSESKAWFLLNQISRSLQILSEKERKHWCICPQTIFYDNNDNWFIHDTYFIWGVDYQNGLHMKLKENKIISPDVKNMLVNGINVGYQYGYEEDMYCLGYVLIFALNGNSNHQYQPAFHSHHHSTNTHNHYNTNNYLQHPNQYSTRYSSPHNNLEEISEKFFEEGISGKFLEEGKQKYSKELLAIISNLIRKDSKLRMTNAGLRKILKDKEISIIRKQSQEALLHSKRNRQKIYSCEKKDTIGRIQEEKGERVMQKTSSLTHLSNQQYGQSSNTFSHYKNPSAVGYYQRNKPITHNNTSVMHEYSYYPSELVTPNMQTSTNVNLKHSNLQQRLVVHPSIHMNNNNRERSHQHTPIVPPPFPYQNPQFRK